MRLLVTGGAGFIGSNFIRHMLSATGHEIINLDKLTYAGNLENLRDVEKSPKYTFIKGDICDAKLVSSIDCDAIFNFAAESHVDRSIQDASSFILTDVVGTYVLLEHARKKDLKFVQISTDEVYGSIPSGSSNEEYPLMPRNPYSASKAGADRLAYSFHTTYGLPVLITRSSNNYGPYQYPEKLIPLFVTNLLEGKKVPLYGDGLNKRDWLYVQDNCEAIDFVFNNGKDGEVYNIGGGNERTNLELTEFILNELKKPKSDIQPVKDRLGHDRRYSLDCSKIKELGWGPRFDFKTAMKETISWYRKNEQWWKPLKR